MTQAIANQLYDQLNEQGSLTPDELSAVWLAEDSGDQTLESQTDLAHWLASVAGCDVVNLRDEQIDKSALRMLPARVARVVYALPIRVDTDQMLVVATFDPLDVVTADRIRRACQRPVRLVCAAKSQLLRYVEIHYGSAEEAAVEKLITSSRNDVIARDKYRDRSSKLLFTEFEDDLGQTPVEQLVDAIVSHAVARRATDIHITCHPQKVVLKHRVDGMLRDVFAIPTEIHRSLITRLKLSAGMDITSKRLPQDGNIEVAVKDTVVQVRAAVFPTIHGEDIALRLLYQQLYNQELRALGFSDWKLKLFQQLLDSSKGYVLVTGPVGVGKTTTLYASLNRLVGHERRIVTLEDPVECRLPDIVQSQISPATGYDFSTGLRSVLRMDPDVLMVGEIRDVETARLSLRASLTGVLVLATLHTDRAAGAVPRLLEMEVEPYLLTSTLRGVLSQGLVRKVCPECRHEHKLSAATLRAQGMPEELSQEIFFKGAGCERCEYTGYYGRTGIFEMLVVDDAIRDQILARAGRLEIEQTARRRGMQTMIEDGLEKARAGVTTFEEVLRITSGR